jgi:hypothetical protein
MLPQQPGATLGMIWGPYGSLELHRDLAGYLATHLVRLDHRQIGPDLSVDRYEVSVAARPRPAP